MKLTTALRLDEASARIHIVSFTGAGGKSSALFHLADELTALGKRVVTTTTTHIAVDQIRRAPRHISVAAGQFDLDEIERLLDEAGHCMLIGRATVDDTETPGEVVKASGVSPELIDELASSGSRLGIDAILVEADGSRMLPAKAPAEHEPVLPAGTTLVIPVIGVDAVGREIISSNVHRAERMLRILSLDVPASPPRLTPRRAAQLLMHPDGGRKGIPPGANVAMMINKVEKASALATARVIATQISRQNFPCLLTHLGERDPIPVIERWECWSIAVLAAGASTRMGSPKQLQIVDGEPMVTRAVRTALDTGAKSVLVVNGAASDAVASVLQPLIAEHPDRVRWVYNPAWRHGQSTSVHVAIDAATDCQALLFMPVDQPFLEASLLRRLAAKWRMGALMAAPFVEGEIRGAPSLFDRRLWPELRALRGDTGGRSLLRHRHDDVAIVAADASTLRDVDTPQDLSNLTNQNR